MLCRMAATISQAVLDNPDAKANFLPQAGSGMSMLLTQGHNFPPKALERMSFETLGLSTEVLRAVTESGYTSPTPIQEKAIPFILMGRDLMGVAQTGTGKTAGFTLPMIDILGSGRGRARMPRSLILEPTRELATQVAENFEKYGKHTKLSMALLIGGESMRDQQQILQRGVDVLIATPGRLLDLFERGLILLADTKLLVIDEADRMLDMGFANDIATITAALPAQRQTLLFSATWNADIEAISGRLEHLRGSALGFRNLTNYIARSLLEAGGFRPQLHPRFG